PPRAVVSRAAARDDPEMPHPAGIHAAQPRSLPARNETPMRRDPRPPPQRRSGHTASRNRTAGKRILTNRAPVSHVTERDAGETPPPVQLSPAATLSRAPRNETPMRRRPQTRGRARRAPFVPLLELDIARWCSDPRCAREPDR